MTIRPNPITYTCPRCNWSKTVSRRSDALMPGEFFDACPSCGNTELETRSQIGLGGGIIQKIKTLFG